MEQLNNQQRKNIKSLQKKKKKREDQHIHVRKLQQMDMYQNTS